MIAAETLAAGGVSVVLIEHMASVGRKFLLAGRGGLNLTHSEDLERFLSRYGAGRTHLERAVRAFTPDDLRSWCDGLGQASFVGSSGRVFPEAFRATPLLRAWRARLEAAGVEFVLRHRWSGWDDEVAAGADALVLALGGASRPRTGSDGEWVATLASAGIALGPLRPSNAGFRVEWSPFFRDKFAGEPLKDVRLSFDEASARADAMITPDGIEGGAIYELSAVLRDALEQAESITVEVDARPDQSRADLARRFARWPAKESTATRLRRVGLAPVVRALLQEAVGTGIPRDPDDLAALVKAVPIVLRGVQPIERAISSAGGVAFAALDEHFMLKSRPGTFVAGEMLDWEAPTGGYLLQASFSTGVAAARGALAWIAARNSP